MIHHTSLGVDLTVCEVFLLKLSSFGINDGYFEGEEIEAAFLMSVHFFCSLFATFPTRINQSMFGELILHGHCQGFAFSYSSFNYQDLIMNKNSR